MLGIEFHPAPTSELIHALGQAVVFGILGGVIPKWTKDRVREKEAGLERDERYEMGLDMDEEDEYGYAEGFVCGTCNNENEVLFGVRVCFVCFCVFGVFIVLVMFCALVYVPLSHSIPFLCTRDSSEEGRKPKSLRLCSVCLGSARFGFPFACMYR